MKNTLPAVIDHVGIICLDLAVCRDIFLPLGFATAGVTKLDSGLAGEQAPTNMHFMFDNAYIECIASNPGDYLRAYLHSDAALHTVVLSSQDIEASRAALVAGGFQPGGVLTASRPADHGAVKGTAEFHWIKLPDGTLPGTLLGVVQHTTKELIYQQTRFQHPNTVYGIRSVFACGAEGERENFCDTWQRLSGALAPCADSTHLVPALQWYSTGDFASAWKTKAGSTRSPYAGIHFSASNIGRARQMAQDAGFATHGCPDGFYIDCMRELSLVLVFSE